MQPHLLREHRRIGSGARMPRPRPAAQEVHQRAQRLVERVASLRPGDAARARRPGLAIVGQRAPQLLAQPVAQPLLPLRLEIAGVDLAEVDLEAFQPQHPWRGHHLAEHLVEQAHRRAMHERLHAFLHLERQFLGVEVDLEVQVLHDVCRPAIAQGAGQAHRTASFGHRWSTRRDASSSTSSSTAAGSSCGPGRHQTRRRSSHRP